MKWLDILIRAGKTAYQAFIAAIIPLGDLLQAAVIAGLAAGASVLQNALAGAEVQASNEVPIGLAEARVVLSDDDTRRIPKPNPLLLLALLPALALTACSGVSPTVRQGLDHLAAADDHAREREAVLRDLLRKSWRALADVEARDGLREDEADGLTTDEAIARLRAALAALDRGDAILDGYEAESAAQARSTGALRAAMAGALRELEARSAATEQLGQALESAAGAAGQIQATREKRKAAEAEARRLEAERAAEEEE